jgi:hypothetical protein
MPAESQTILKPLEMLVKEADSIVVGEVSHVTEKRERMLFDGVKSWFLTTTVHFKTIDVLKGDPKRKTLRQYSPLSDNWAKGDSLIVFLNKPTVLRYDGILEGGRYILKGDKVHGLFYVNEEFLDVVSLDQIRALSKQPNK